MIRKPGKRLELEGMAFGRLKVVRRSEKPRHWVCVCRCGVEKDVSSSNLLGGIIKSCGCLRREQSARTGLNNRGAKPHRRIDAASRFEAMVIPEPNSGCWLWEGSLNTNGRGHFMAEKGGKLHLAHRYSYELHRGPVPDGLDVLHKCDNPVCVNPDHLYCGTAAENSEDRYHPGLFTRYGFYRHTEPKKRGWDRR